ncbi:MAG: type II secretion system protein [Verrucomicrobia bacterium]|nr:type II secretion system protein [Verrucomicrobiota bacterium]
MKRRASFTLIEIVVTMALVILVGSLMTVLGNRMFQEKQFEIASKKLSEELALTESLALTYQIDITVFLKKSGKDLVLTREVDRAPPKIAFLFEKSITFSHIQLENREEILRFYGNHHKEMPPSLALKATQIKKCATIDTRFFHVYRESPVNLSSQKQVE